jgi:hypothetical protein
VAGARRADYGSVLPDPDCYEERHRLTGAALSLAVGLLALGLVLWHTELIVAAFGVLAVIPAKFALARRPVAFRADPAGITLGSVGRPDSPRRLLPSRRAVFVPWADVGQIILYTGYQGGGGDPVQCIGIQRREGAPALPDGNEQDLCCPVPGVAAGMTRRITGWRLDRERLAAITAAMAPGIPVVETSADLGPSI